MELAKLWNSRVKGHHVFRSQARPGDSFICIIEPANPHSPYAIVVKLSNGTTIGHVPDALARVVTLLLVSGVVQRMVGTVTGSPRSANEGVWVKGGGTELPTEYVLFGLKEERKSVRQSLRVLITKLKKED